MTVNGINSSAWTLGERGSDDGKMGKGCGLQRLELGVIMQRHPLARGQYLLYMGRVGMCDAMPISANEESCELQAHGRVILILSNLDCKPRATTAGKMPSILYVP